MLPLERPTPAPAASPVPCPKTPKSLELWDSPKPPRPGGEVLWTGFATHLGPGFCVVAKHRPTETLLGQVVLKKPSLNIGLSGPHALGNRPQAHALRSQFDSLSDFRVLVRRRASSAIVFRLL